MKILNVLTGLGLFILVLSCSRPTEETNVPGDLRMDSAGASEKELVESASIDLINYPSLFLSDRVNSFKIVRLAAHHQMREIVRQLMVRYFQIADPDNLAEDLLLFADIYRDGLGDRIIAGFIYLNFLEQFQDHHYSDSVVMILPEARKTSEALIEEAFLAAFGFDGEIESRVAANRFMIFSEIYAVSKPDNSSSPEFLFQAAEVAKALGMESRSDFNIRWMINKFRNHSLTPNALFFKAFSRGELAEDRIRAMQLYQEFLLLYPDHELAPHVKMLVESTGLSNEELLRAIRNQNKKREVE